MSYSTAIHGDNRVSQILDEPDMVKYFTAHKMVPLSDKVRFNEQVP